MIAVIQRVTKAEVTVVGESVGRIDQGIMALIAVEKSDSEDQAERLSERILKYRIFTDDHQKMNLSVKEINGGVLLIPQFTLAADTQKGNRPSFEPAADPEKAQRLFSFFVGRLKAKHSNVTCGKFGADMQVSLINDGPVTFILKANSP